MLQGHRVCRYVQIVRDIWFDSLALDISYYLRKGCQTSEGAIAIVLGHGPSTWASAAANPDEQVPGPGAGNKTDALRLFDKAVHDKFFWAYLDPGFSLLYMLPLILWWF